MQSLTRRDDVNYEIYVEMILTFATILRVVLSIMYRKTCAVVMRVIGYPHMSMFAKIRAG